MKPSYQYCNLSQFLISISLISTSQVIIHTLPSISLGIFIGGGGVKWYLFFLCSTFSIWLLPSPVYWKFSCHGPLVTKLKVSFSPLLKGHSASVKRHWPTSPFNTQFLASEWSYGFPVLFLHLFCWPLISCPYIQFCIWCWVLDLSPPLMILSVTMN